LIQIRAVTLVSTVSADKAQYSPRDGAAAETARLVYRLLGRPSEADFQHILRHNLLRNYPVTPQDASRAFRIYGPDVPTLKGKTTKASASPPAPTLFDRSPPIPEEYQDITLCVDIFFVQGVCFLHSISRGIGFPTVSFVATRQSSTILSELRSIFALELCAVFAFAMSKPTPSLRVCLRSFPFKPTFFPTIATSAR
jgi:hypothetical protein